MSELLLRPMTAADLPAAEALQLICYPPELRDAMAAFGSRIALAGHGCLVAIAGGTLRGYILAHPWPGRSPPAPDTILAEPAGAPLVHYIHDLSIAPAGRGQGVGRRLVAMSQAIARGQGLMRSELIAVGGAGPYWQGLGYRADTAGDALAAKLRAYGADAAYMARDLLDE